MRPQRSLHSLLVPLAGLVAVGVYAQVDDQPALEPVAAVAAAAPAPAPAPASDPAPSAAVGGISDEGVLGADRVDDPRQVGPAAPPAPTTTVAPSTTTTRPPGRNGRVAPPIEDPVWDRLAQCESGGNWAINTGNGYYGGLQFLLSSWRAYGGQGYPHHWPRDEQVRVAQLVYEDVGWRAWPSCTRKLGLR